MRTIKFEIYEDASGQWRWRLLAKNGSIIAASNEAFDSKGNAKRAARKLRDTYLAGAELVEVEKPADHPL